MKPFRLLLLICFCFVTACSVSRDYLPEVPLIEKSVPVEKSQEPYPTFTPSATFTASPTALPTMTPTQTPVPPTVTPTPFDLSIFSPTNLREGVSPVSYLEDPCHYLLNKWDEEKSPPGTIVVPIMFHSIAKPGREINDSTTISMAYFEYFMAKAKDMGFSTITTEELISFLEDNQKIPERSMILILDDRRPGVTELFMPYLEQNDWTLTLAWLSTDATSDFLWDQMETLAESGRLDVQSHGHNSIYIQDYVPLDVIEEELFKPRAIIEEHFGLVPQAHIWSGGNFTETSIRVARMAGYKVGFTAYSRGPIMFNWIPLGQEERAINDPLMVLPRYWSTAADVALDHALSFSEGARQAADAVKAEELRYISLYCQTPEGD